MTIRNTGQAGRASSAPFAVLTTDARGAPSWHRHASAREALAQWTATVENRLLTDGLCDLVAPLRALLAGATAGHLGLDRVYRTLNTISAPCGIVLWAGYDTDAAGPT